MKPSKPLFDDGLKIGSGCDGYGHIKIVEC
jgi:hypothetical protein